MNEPPVLTSVNLFVRDMAASLAFYRRLGLAIPEGMESRPHVEVALTGGLMLEIDTVQLTRSYDPGWQEPAGGSRNTFQFRLASREAVDACYAELTGAGYGGHKPPWNAFWGARYAIVDDPDGNSIGLTSAADPALHGPMPPL